MKKIVVFTGLLSLLVISPVKAQKDTSNLPVIDTLFAHTQKDYMAGKFGDMKPKLDKAEVMLSEIYPDSLHDRMGSLFSFRGDYYLEAESDFLESIKYYKIAADINYRLYGENLYYAALNNNIGYCYKQIADYDNAIKYYRIDQRILRKEKGEYCIDMGIAYNVLGDLYTARGFYKKSVSAFNKSIDIIAKVGGIDHPNLIFTYNNMGLALKYMGDYKMAEGFYQKALQIAISKMNNRPHLHAHLYNNLAKLKMNEDRYQESIDLFSKGYDIALKAFGEKHPLSANFMKSLAESYMFLEDNEKAEELMNRSQSVLIEIFGNNHPSVAMSYELKGSYFFRKGDLDSAYYYSKKTFDIATKAFPFTKIEYFDAYSDLSQILIKQQRYAEAAKLLKEAIDIYIKNSDLLDNHDYILEIIDHLYKMMFVADYHLGNKEKVVSALEQSVSGKKLYRSYEKHLFQEYASDYQREEYERIGRMIAHADIKRKQYARRMMAKKSSEMNEEYNRLISSKRDLEKRVIESNSRYSAGVFNQILDYNKIIKDKILNNNQCAVYYIFLDKKIYYVILNNKQLNVVEKDADSNVKSDVDMLMLLSSKKAIDEGIYEVDKGNRIEYLTSEQLKKEIGVRAFVNEYLFKKSTLSITDIENKIVECNNRLYKNLIDPIESEIKGFKDLIIIPQSGFAELPLKMLYKNYKGEKRYFIESYNVQQVNSLTIYADKKAREERYSELVRKRMLAIGISDFVIKGDSLFSKYGKMSDKEIAELDKDKDYLAYRSITRSSLGGEFVDLKNAIKEVSTISDLMSDKNSKKWVLTNKDATEVGIKELNKEKELKKAEIIHISTHGAISNENIEKSSLVMYDYTGMGPSDDIIANDGYLTIKEILQFDLNSDLVVLSACETSSGKKDIEGNIYGLIYAFYLSGANNIIASTWEVDDESTAAFFIEFYTRLKNGEEMSEALNNVYRCFATSDKKRSRERVKPESKELKELLRDKKYADPFYWAAFGLY
ncbi:MAG: CHAT domain-containing protein [Bacteroidales bacterium]|jgi:CHAT domain-containing protein|nr:CHAT domain-containing protein [Bacteroidales bacterium]